MSKSLSTGNFVSGSPIIIDARDILRTVNQLGAAFDQKQINKICSRSINEALMRGRTIARTEVKRVYTIAQRGLNGRIDIDRSTPFARQGKVLHNTYLTGAIIASTKPVPMDLFTVSFNPSRKTQSTITRRGKIKVSKTRRSNFKGGVTIEAVKGRKEVIPFAFMLVNNKAKVFARGNYRPGKGSYGFVQRHKRLENSNGNDSVTSMLSVTVHAAAINRNVQAGVDSKITAIFPGIFFRQLNAQFNNAFKTMVP